MLPPVHALPFVGNTIGVLLVRNTLLVGFVVVVDEFRSEFHFVAFVLDVVSSH